MRYSNWHRTNFKRIEPYAHICDGLNKFFQIINVICEMCIRDRLPVLPASPLLPFVRRPVHNYQSHHRFAVSLTQPCNPPPYIKLLQEQRYFNMKNAKQPNQYLSLIRLPALILPFPPWRLNFPFAAGLWLSKA